MAVRPKRYISQGGRKVRAVKVTEKNVDDLQGWVSRNATNLRAEPYVMLNQDPQTGDKWNHRLRLHLAHKGIRVARVGDYVFHILNDDLSLSDGTLYILKGKIFEEKYTEIPKA